MEFDGTFEIDDVSTEDVWLALSDPVMIKRALPGCQFLVEVNADDDVDFDELRERDDGDPVTLPEADPETIADRAFVEGGRYAALVEIGVGSVKPSFETFVTIDDREFPDMSAMGEGSSGNSSFELDAGMHIAETDDGVAVEWSAQTDVFGRIAQMGQRMLNPVANRVVDRFFGNVEEQLRGVESEDPDSLRDRLSGLF